MPWRKPRSAAPLLLMVLLPLEVEVPLGASAESDSVSATTSVDGRDRSDGPRYELDMAAGTGRFAIVPRSCALEPLASFEAKNTDAAVALTRTSANGLVVGIRGGWIRDEIVSSSDPLLPEGAPADREIIYFNPWVGVEKSWFALRGGGLVQTEDFPVTDAETKEIPFSAGVRLGPPSIHAFFSLMESVPLQSGGGYRRLGLGTSRRDRYDVWVAVAGEPHDGDGLAVGADVRVLSRVSLLVRGRLGESEGIDENSIAAGLRFHSRPPK